jgi:Adenylate cyclase, family 3 (some proteins contain HAMP domain)
MERTRFRKGQGTFVSDDNDKHTRGQVYPFRPGRNGSGPPEELPRRLAAILAADIAGYSRLMGHDEEGTHARVRRQRRELIEPTIAEHHGRLVKYTVMAFWRCSIVLSKLFDAPSSFSKA